MEDQERCVSCHKIRKLETAPFGGMVCDDCNEIFKAVNMARWQGLSDEELGARIRRLIEGMSDE